LARALQVAADAAEGQQAALVVQDGKHFVERLAGALHDQRQCEGVEVAHAVVLRQAALRTKAHARGHALAAANGAQRTRSAQMAGDDAPSGTEEFGRPHGDVAVAGAVEPVAADQPALRPFVRDGIVAVTVGNRAMEIGLENRHQGDFRQLLAQQPHRLDVGWVVGRGHLVHLFHRAQHVGRHSLHAGDPPAMHCLKRDGRHFRGLFQAAGLRIG
jgi:hypothetical protein